MEVVERLQREIAELEDLARRYKDQKDPKTLWGMELVLTEVLKRRQKLARLGATTSAANH